MRQLKTPKFLILISFFQNQTKHCFLGEEEGGDEGLSEEELSTRYQVSRYCMAFKCHLRMLEYMLQSRESSWGFPSTLLDHSEFITGQCKKILSRANKNEIKCFEFGGIKKSIKTSLENNYSWINFNISICFPLWENMTILSK